MVLLPNFPGLSDHHAEGINLSGDVAGWGRTPQGVEYALLWRRNQSVSDPTAPNSYLAPIDLGATLRRRGRAYDINNDGKVVGQAQQSSNRFNYDPFVWDPVTGMRIMPKPSGGDAKIVRLSNTQPAIGVGRAMVNGKWHAIRWQLP
jgi:probable HAF family extracellular repeat protein